MSHVTRETELCDIETFFLNISPLSCDIPIPIPHSVSPSSLTFCHLSLFFSCDITHYVSLVKWKMSLLWHSNSHRTFSLSFFLDISHLLWFFFPHCDIAHYVCLVKWKMSLPLPRHFTPFVTRLFFSCDIAHYGVATISRLLKMIGLFYRI